MYQNEESDSCVSLEDGNIVVTTTQNLYDYGVFIGLEMAIRAGLVPSDSWFLVLHDTCRAGPRFKESIEETLKVSGHHDIIWLCSSGQCNLCLMRNIVSHGYGVYNGMDMTKQYAIDIEYRGEDSIKSFPCNQFFWEHQVAFEGPSDVYGDLELYGNRVTVKFENVDLEKYYYYR